MVFVKFATFGAICRTIKTLLWYHQDLKVRTRIIEGLSRPYLLRFTVNSHTFVWLFILDWG